MLSFRTFRNTDPPRLIEVWNEAFPGRGAVTLRTATPLERFVLSKPYFDPAGLILAEENGACVGFAHAGMVEDDQRRHLPARHSPPHRRRGIGSRAAALARRIPAAAAAPRALRRGRPGLNPFYFGLYGGAVCSGFLHSDPAAEPFFTKHGYRVAQTLPVLHRPLDVPLRGGRPRFAQHPQHAARSAC